MKSLFVLILLLNAVIGFGDTVVCVHGLMRKGGSMSTMARSFEKKGCEVVK